MRDLTLGPLAAGMPGVLLPHRWEWVRLEDVARLESGHTPSRRHPEYWGGPVAWLGIRDARAHHGREIFQTAQTISEAGLANSSARLLPRGTVCLSRTASVGYVCVLGVPMATSQDFVNWICSEAIDPHYLKFVFLAAGRERLATLGEGTVHTTVYMPTVRTLHVALPPKNEQARIVARLTELFERVARAGDVLENVPLMSDEVRRSFLAAAFRGTLSASWRQDHQQLESRTLLTSIQEERRRRWSLGGGGKPYVEPVVAREQLRLPPSWSVATLEALTDPVRPVRYGILKPGPEVEGGVPYVEVRDMRGGHVELSGLSRTDHRIHARYLRSSIATGDLLISVRGSYGAVVAVGDELHGANISRDVARIAPLPGVDADYLRFALVAPQSQRYFDSVAAGIAVRGLNLADLRLTTIPLPPVAEQREIVRRLERALLLSGRAADACPAFATELQHIRDQALGHAFRGLLVASDPDDVTPDLAAARAEVTAGRKQAKETRLKELARAMKPIDRDTMLDAVGRMPRQTFTFEELRRALPGDYEAFRDTLFELLSEPSPVLMQEFDDNAGAVTLQVVR